MEALMAKIRDIMRFDPEQKGYTPEIGKMMMESRRRLAKERGVSTWVTSGGKGGYEKRKREKAMIQHASIANEG